MGTYNSLACERRSEKFVPDTFLRRTAVPATHVDRVFAAEDEIVVYFTASAVLSAPVLTAFPVSLPAVPRALPVFVAAFVVP